MLHRSIKLTHWKFSLKSHRTDGTVDCQHNIIPGKRTLASHYKKYDKKLFKIQIHVSVINIILPISFRNKTIKDIKYSLLYIIYLILFLYIKLQNTDVITFLHTQIRYLLFSTKKKKRFFLDTSKNVIRKFVLKKNTKFHHTNQFRVFRICRQKSISYAQQRWGLSRTVQRVREREGV